MLKNKLALALLEAQKCKRWKTNTLQTSASAEKNLIALARKINCRKYQIRPSLCFIAFAPVKREIFAGDFRDRVVHHFIFQALNADYDKLFINDCYSCRQNRGTGFGISRIAQFQRAVSNNYQGKAYVLKLDISGYFMNIDRQKLYAINQRLICHFFFQEPSKINTLLYLLKKVIFNDPTIDCRRRGCLEDWKGLPKNKSLFDAAKNKGLPIGNLTSQLFGNVYLNGFDHFVKEKLKCRYYGRYVDDMIFMHQDKEYLKAIIAPIKQYLKTELGLSLHPQKIYLQPITHGVPFLGAFIKPHRIYCGRRMVKNFRQKIRQAARGQLKNPAFFNSYLGQMKKYSSFNLRQKILNSSEAKLALQKFNAYPDDDLGKIIFRH